MVAVVEPGVAKWINGSIRSYGAKLHPSPESMLEKFEIPASGCVASCDEIAEL
jgi:hypothetical protein